jgi:hypothetical protein
MIENKTYRIERTELGDRLTLEAIKRVIGPKALRWYVARASAQEITVEATLYAEMAPGVVEETSQCCYAGKTVVLHVVPTGVGCRIGGYAGDAAPVTSLLASTVDYLITNPNAVNASDFINLDPNVVYTDGYGIDWFMQGQGDLYMPYGNRVGVIIERSDESKLDVVFNVINAVRAVHGVDIAGCEVTAGPVGSRCVRNGSGAFVGTVDHPEMLLAACDRLVAQGATAIAITTSVQDLPLDGYAQHFAGEYPNPVGGTEAVISYLVANHYRLPVAHAPLLNMKQIDLRHPVVDARGAGEMVSVSGLACTLVGLRQAPQMALKTAGAVKDILNLHNLLAVVMPASCLGGVPALSAQQWRVPVIAVQDNHTILEVTAAKLGLNAVEVSSYAEAAGVILALKRGLSLESLTRPLKTIRY